MPLTAIDVSQLIHAMREGDEEAFRTLLEADKSIAPMLVRHFQEEAIGSCRARIIELIWNRRDQQIVPFLASALHDTHSEVWKQAIDGLVTIGGIESRLALAQFLEEIPKDSERALWVQEALEQIPLAE